MVDCVIHPHPAPPAHRGSLGLARYSRHVIGCQITQEMRVETDAAGNICSTLLSGGFTTAAAGLAATIASNIALPLKAVAAEPIEKKVVQVPYAPYVVTSESSAESMEVARALKAAGARLYGAFWCENCNKQKELFGKEAMALLGVSYVECFPNGVYQNAPGMEDFTKPDKICDGRAVQVDPRSTPG